MIRKDLRTAIEMNRLETFTAHSLAGLLAASSEEQAKRHRQNASTLLYELAQRGEIVCVGREGLHKVYRKAKPSPTRRVNPRGPETQQIKPDPTTKKPLNIQERWQQEKPEPDPISKRMRHLTESDIEPTRNFQMESYAQIGTEIHEQCAKEIKAQSELTDIQIGRAVINLVAHLEATIVGLNSRVTALAKEKQLAAAEHHRQLDAKEQALRAAQDTIRQLEHKLQQATLIRRPQGGAPLTMAIGKLLDSAGAGL